MAACAATAGADEKTFEFSGFGTAGFAVTDTDKAGFIRTESVITSLAWWVARDRRTVHPICTDQCRVMKTQRA
jgi:hypothetical protein